MRPSRFIRDFSDAVSAARSASELNALIESAARDLGFEYVALLHSLSLFRQSPWLIRYDSYPDGWDKRLLRRGHKIIDPMLLIARRRLSAFLWSDVLRQARLSSVQQSVLTDAYRFGIRQGITIPANVPGEPDGSISFASGRTGKIGQERILAADAVGRIAFDAARRIAGLRDIPDIVPQVSDRVRECIYWIAHGKTDQDVADILGIGLETVRTYIKSAFQLLGVITRAQLVHEALRLGLIDPDPSIPPFG
jgi:DNA-binding CsgD family transcriptional regulator